MSVCIKRVYEAPAQADGLRILVDRLWPRGVSKTAAHLDLWLKEVAPSTALRQWFGHDPDKWQALQARYRLELQSNPAWSELQSLARQHKHITLLYAAKDPVHNQAVLLKQFLEHGI